MNQLRFMVFKISGLKGRLLIAFGLLTFFTTTAVAQESITLKGTVTDIETDETLPGVNVLVRGTTTGTFTDENGNFELPVPSLQDTLEVSFIGYQAKPIPINGRTELNIQLTPQAIMGEEMVVVGYGEQKRENVTGAVSSINYDKELENRPITNASQALGGKVTGVWASQNSGAPGSDGSTLRIRGFGTLNNNNPLVLIDGVEGRLAELNPNDIASISVLKDAASAAIYGSRAANGVVLVTTKEGSYDAEPEVSYNGYYGVQQLGQRYDIMDNSVEFMDIWNTAIVNNGGDPIFSQQVMDAFENGNDPYQYPNTNFFDEVFRTAPITEHNLSVSGGSENQRYYLSVNYLDQDGIIKQTNSNRYGVNFNLSSQINDRLEIGGNLRATRKITGRPYNGISRVMYMMSNGGYPFIAPYTRDGNFGATQAVYMSGENEGQPIVDSRNPLPDVYNGLTEYTNNFIKGSLDATLDITEGLSLQTLYSGQYNTNTRDRYNEMIYVYTDGGFRNTTLDFPSTITNQRYNNEEFYWNFYNTLNYEGSFAGIHNVSAIAGVQLEAEQNKSISAEKSDPPKEGLNQVDAATSNPIAGGNATSWRMFSYFGRINYNFDEKYLFEANLRADASSRFKSGNRWGLFPSFSAGWRLSEESFMDSFDSISNLKIRASWGRLGNQNIGGIAGDYPYLTTITQSNGTSYNLGSQLVPGAAVTALVDEDISWEISESFDLGLELGLFESKLNFEAGYFNKTTKDILVRLPIPEILGGVSPPVENVGKMKNSGLELAVSYQSASSGDWNYNIGGNITYVDNQVTTFRGGNAPDQLYLIREGISYQALYGYQKVGVYQTDEEAAGHMDNNGYTPTAGDLKYRDVNNDGRLNFEDKQVLGNTIPKYTYGLNLGVSFKNWNLNMAVQGIADVSAYTQNAWTEPLGISGATVTERWKNAWTPENNSTTLPHIKINDTWNRQQSSFWVTDLSYLKIKNVQLGYELPNKWLTNFGLNTVSAYVNLQNPYTFVSNNYEGFNPERSTFNSGSGQYPTPITTTLGINIQF